MNLELCNIKVEDGNFENFTGYDLHLVAKAGKVKAAEMILNSNPSQLYSKNKKGNTPMHIAARLGHLELTLVLINHSKRRGDADIHMNLLRMENDKKDTVLHEAVRNGHYSIVELLIEEDHGLASFTNDANESPLFLALDREFYKIAFHILESVQDFSIAGRDGMNALHASIIRTKKKNHLKQVEGEALFLLNIYLYITQFISTVSKLFDSKEDHQKSKRGSEFVGKLLQSCPEAVEEADVFGWTPLHYAANLGNVKIVEEILRINRSMVSIKDKEGMSALHVAAKAGEIDVLRTIIATFPDSSELVDDKDRTALHVAVESGSKIVMKYLLGMIPFHDIINEEDKEGNTVLHLAAIQGHHEILEQLASDHRVDKLARNKQGSTVIDIIQSDMELPWYQKVQMISKLEDKGSLSSLRGVGIGNKDASEEKVESGDGISVAFSISRYIQDVSTANFLVSSIIATVTFSAVFQVPGGYDSDGMAILRNESDFREFLIYNSLAFTFSLMSMITHFHSIYFRNFHSFSYPMTFVRLSTQLSLIFMLLSFLMSMKATMATDSWFEDFTWPGTIATLIPTFVYGISRTKWSQNFGRFMNRNLHHFGF